MIRKALNPGWTPNLTSGRVCYAKIMYCVVDGEEYSKAIERGYVLGKTLRINSKEYTLIIGGYEFRGNGIMNMYKYSDGLLNADFGLLACKTIEIAQHMSKYFAQEIFDAAYAQYMPAYEWDVE